jgi:hypothetical protein
MIQRCRPGSESSTSSLPKPKMRYAELVWLVKLGFHRSQTESKESRAVFKRGDGASVPAAKGLLLV